MNKRMWIAVAIGVGLVLLLVLFLAYRNSPAHTSYPLTFQGEAETFMQKLIKKDGVATYDQLTIAMQSQISQRDWIRNVQQTLAQYTGGLHLESAQPLSDPFHAYAQGSDPHQVIYTLTIKKVKWTTMLILINDSGRWYIDQMKSYQS